MQLAVPNPLARITVQFFAYLCIALAASNLVIQTDFASKLNLVWIFVCAVLITLIFKQGAVARIVIAALLTIMGLAVLALTATGDLYWAHWSR